MKRVLISISGCVQGVGFRPFAYRLAHRHGLAGHIKNTQSGVFIDVQGSAEALKSFLHDLRATLPPLAAIYEMAAEDAPLHEAASFDIRSSGSDSETTLPLLPDTAICQECLRELLDPRSRRYIYPFIHCVACGPRFSLFLRMPFDRENTTMTDFPMCGECLKEYADPSDRRFYSQTNCCPQCGPELRLIDPKGKGIANHHKAIQEAIDYLRQGKIVALKNTGGFQLLADAANEHAVDRLRSLKHRPCKPFALLFPDMLQVKQSAYTSPIAESVLTSPAAPIVLLKKRPENNQIVHSASPDNPFYGIMLPHNALQHLLISSFAKPLVATSGNISEKPLCITEQEALSQLSEVADVFLVHNRRIMHRLDDSIVHLIAGRPMLIRRARGYIPYAVKIPPSLPSIPESFAAGGQLKNTFALGKKNTIYLSQHIGNLEEADACQAYGEEVDKWEKLLRLNPIEGTGDKHPGYYTTEYLQKRKMDAITIQHHQAHVWSGMADNPLSPPFFSIVWDGTGLGDDHTIWGGEGFIADQNGIRRFASLYPFRLPGSEKAVREPRRSALGAMHAIVGAHPPKSHADWLHTAFTQEELSILTDALTKAIQSPICSSIGRLFDAVSALLGSCYLSHFEGQAALALEYLACQRINSSIHYPFPLFKENGIWLMDWRPMLNRIFEDRFNGMPLTDIAYGFHDALAYGIVRLAQTAQLENVLLTGGVMQNQLLAEMAISKLLKAGFKPHWHQHIPPNDGGLAVGQMIGRLFETKGDNNVPCPAG